MSKEEFEITLRRFLERRPFQPFVIDLLEGRRVTVRVGETITCSLTHRCQSRARSKRCGQTAYYVRGSDQVIFSRCLKQPPVVFRGGAASFIDPADGTLVDFSHDEVRTFSIGQQEVAV